MKPFYILRDYWRKLSPRAVRLLLIGLIPILTALLFLLYALFLSPVDFSFDGAWFSRNFAYVTDTVSISLLLLIGGCALLDFSEKHDKA